MLDKTTGKSRGFAFVEFTGAEAAQRAIDQLHNKEFRGRRLAINVARPRQGTSARPENDRGERRARQQFQPVGPVTGPAGWPVPVCQK